MLLDIGKFTVDRNKFFARKGQSLSSNDRPRDLPNLQQTTINIRKQIQKKFPEFIDGQFFRADRSNVTLSGQLLESLEFRIKNDSVVLLFKGNRRKIRKDDASTNDEVYENLVDLGFDFLGLDEKGQKRVKRIVIDELRREIRKYFKK